MNLLALALACVAMAHSQAVDPAPPLLTVRGEAILRKPADQLRIDLGVVTTAETAAEAIKANADRMRTVLAAVDALGLDEDERQTTRFLVQPLWSQRPRQAPADWRREITGFEARNTIRVRTNRLELAGDLIGRASGAGANEFSSLVFDLADPRVHRAEAIALATAHAIEDANTMAAAASVRLVAIRSIALDNAVIQPKRTTVSYEYRAAALAEADTTPIESGDVTVTARVSITWEIAPAE